MREDLPHSPAVDSAKNIEPDVRASVGIHVPHIERSLRLEIKAVAVGDVDAGSVAH